jgi:molybdate transport system permease protein
MEALTLSLVVAACAVVICLPLGTLLAYFLARYDFRGKALVEVLINLSLVVPPVVVGYLLLVFLGRNSALGGFLFETFGIQLAFSTTAAVIAAAVVSFPLLVRSIRTSFQAIDPELEAAARTLGSGPLSTFFRVSIPLARNGLISGAVIAFARSLGEFGATIVFAGNISGETQTLALAIYSIAERPGGLESAWRLVLLSVIISAAAIYFSNRIEAKNESIGRNSA